VLSCHVTQRGTHKMASKIPHDRPASISRRHRPFRPDDGNWISNQEIFVVRPERSMATRYGSWPVMRNLRRLFFPFWVWLRVMFWWLAHSQRGRAASEYRSMDDLLQIAPVGATVSNLFCLADLWIMSTTLYEVWMAVNFTPGIVPRVERCLE
jgi:hypothetical protein